ncbi:MAG: hypothetical protein JSU98_06405 [Gemmatimonadales bacterium]|jgi:hypothetical protein|nr:MAG: hypothetical protein JSU98_06405 [Gemmatimonadales bacterium]
MKTRSTILFGSAVAIAVVIAVLAPDRDAPPSPTDSATQTPLPEGHPPLAGAAAPAAQGPFATVLETMASGGYTYARVTLNGEEMWVAGPTTPLSEGDQIALGGAMGMENFYAASLDRNFESILFLNGFVGPQDAGAAAASPAAGSGTVLEVLYGAGYTFVRVDQDGSETWIAGMATDIAEGQTVSWSAGSVMQNFESPTLGRTFEEILFVDGLQVTG